MVGLGSDLTPAYRRRDWTKGHYAAVPKTVPILRGIRLFSPEMSAKVFFSGPLKEKRFSPSKFK
jgi:hypothetical protein